MFAEDNDNSSLWCRTAPNHHHIGRLHSSSCHISFLLVAIVIQFIGMFDTYFRLLPFVFLSFVTLVRSLILVVFIIVNVVPNEECQQLLVGHWQLPKRYHPPLFSTIIIHIYAESNLFDIDHLLVSHIVCIMSMLAIYFYRFFFSIFFSVTREIAITWNCVKLCFKYT